MARIRIGTASWTDRSLIESGRYYPDSCTLRRRPSEVLFRGISSGRGGQHLLRHAR